MMVCFVFYFCDNSEQKQVILSICSSFTFIAPFNDYTHTQVIQHFNNNLSVST